MIRRPPKSPLFPSPPPSRPCRPCPRRQGRRAAALDTVTDALPLHCLLHLPRSGPAPRLLWTVDCLVASARPARRHRRALRAQLLHPPPLQSQPRPTPYPPLPPPHPRYGAGATPPLPAACAPPAARCPPSG